MRQMLKKVLLSLTKLLIVMVSVSYIFSLTSLDTKTLVKETFEDVYTHSSPNATKQIVKNMAETCTAIEERNEGFDNIIQVCNNFTLISSMEANCANYRKLKERGAKALNEEELEKACGYIESGEFQDACEQVRNKKLRAADVSEVKIVCEKYNAGEINEGEFFKDYVVGSFVNEDMLTPDNKILERYSEAVSYINQDKSIYIAALLVLIAILYLLTLDAVLFAKLLSALLINVGLIILLPYAAIFSYTTFAGIDTTPLFTAIGGSQGIDIKTVAEIILLSLLNIYSEIIIRIAAAALILGSIANIITKIINRKRAKEQGMEVSAPNAIEPAPRDGRKMNELRAEKEPERLKHPDKKAKRNAFGFLQRLGLAKTEREKKEILKKIRKDSKKGKPTSR